MINYYWTKKDVCLDLDEIAPWKLPCDKHTTISVLKHRVSELGTIDKYLARCERYFKIEYLRRMNGTIEHAWHTAMIELNATFNKRRRSVVLEYLQCDDNKEFREQRGGPTSFYDLQEDFFKKVSEKYGAVRGNSTSLVKNKNHE